MVSFVRISERGIAFSLPARSAMMSRKNLKRTFRAHPIDTGRRFFGGGIQHMSDYASHEKMRTRKKH